MLAFIVPTRDRPAELALTLERLGAIPPHDLPRGCEVVIVDNDSPTPPDPPARLPNGLPVTLIRLGVNLAAASRNIAARAVGAPWLIMLDDDSSPLIPQGTPGPGTAMAHALDHADPRTAAIGGEILLPSGSREAGGLPEVPVGCGCAIRRDAFLAVGGYDPAFGFYAEEYDLAARLIRAGWRIEHARGLRFEHRKSSAGRDFNAIIRRLVRNNAWTIRRHAPAHLAERAERDMIDRYHAIADRENAAAGLAHGLGEIDHDPALRPGRRMTNPEWDRFTGAAAVRRDLIPELVGRGIARVGLVAPGKGAEVIRAELQAAGIDTAADNSDPQGPAGRAAQARVIATLSPGPMLDASARFPDALPPWNFGRWPDRRPAAAAA